VNAIEIIEISDKEDFEEMSAEIVNAIEIIEISDDEEDFEEVSAEVFQRAKAVRRKTVPRKRARDDSEDPDDAEVTSDWSTPSQNLRTRKARVVEPARAAEPARIPTRHPDKATKRVLKAHRRAQNALLGLPQYQSK
jgi:hypothetical protein